MQLAEDQRPRREAVTTKADRSSMRPLPKSGSATGRLGGGRIQGLRGRPSSTWSRTITAPKRPRLTWAMRSMPWSWNGQAPIVSSSRRRRSTIPRRGDLVAAPSSWLMTPKARSRRSRCHSSPACAWGTSSLAEDVDEQALARLGVDDRARHPPLGPRLVHVRGDHGRRVQRRIVVVEVSRRRAHRAAARPRRSGSSRPRYRGSACSRAGSDGAEASPGATVTPRNFSIFR